MLRILLSSSPDLIETAAHGWIAACLRERGHLVEALRHSKGIAFGEASKAEDFDVVVACMTGADGQMLADELPDRRLIIMPLPEYADAQPDGWWQQFQTHRFIALSRKLHEQLLQAGLDSAYFQYFPPAMPSPIPASQVTGRHALLWKRGGVTWAGAVQAARQCLMLGFDHLYICAMAAQDREASGKARLNPFIRAGLHISVADSGKPSQDFTDLFARHDCVILPDPSLADMPVLAQAMAMGRLVIAPEYSPASDYLAHGLSGLLYDPLAPLASLRRGAIDLAALADAALARAKRGHALWQGDQKRLTSLLIDDGARWSTSDCSAGFGNLLRRRAGDAARVG